MNVVATPVHLSHVCSVYGVWCPINYFTWSAHPAHFPVSFFQILKTESALVPLFACG